MTQFPENVALLGGALAFPALATVAWAPSAGASAARGPARSCGSASGDPTTVKRSHTRSRYYYVVCDVRQAYDAYLQEL